MIDAQKPAYLGGPRSVVAPIPTWPVAGDTERRALQNVIASNHWWGIGGPMLREFEERFARAHDAAWGLAVTNGTHAIELGLRTLGIGFGDEVIVPALTFVATSMAVLSVGARPVPVDVRSDTLCIDANEVERALTPRTKCVIPVHFAGHPADMRTLSAICARRSIPILEDAAHAHGAAADGTSVGAQGALAAFSFQNFKLMSSGEGGILLGSDPALRRVASQIANCGREPGDMRYEHPVAGSNFRMTEFQGAVLLGQLERLPTLAAIRQVNAQHLENAVRSIPGIRVQATSSHVDRHARYMFVLVLDPESFGGMDRDLFVEALRAEGLPAYRMYPPVQHTGHFAAAVRRLGHEATIASTPVSDEIGKQGVWLHHSLLLGDEILPRQAGEAIEKIRLHASAIIAKRASRHTGS